VGGQPFPAHFSLSLVFGVIGIFFGQQHHLAPGGKRCLHINVRSAKKSIALKNRDFMIFTDFILLFVALSITGVTIALTQIRKSIDNLAAEIRKGDRDNQSN
jgi:hypothetical protein